MSAARAAEGRMLRSALTYARWGWAVFPCRGKKPATKNGLKNASDDIDLITKWWAKVDHNIGIATGSVSGVWVLDIDTGDGKVGEDSLKQLEAEHGEIPTTWQAISGGGGMHYYFSLPKDADFPHNSASAIAPDIDVRGEGGYIIAPPSKHERGREYAWEVEHHPKEVKIAPAPDWLLKLALGATLVNGGPPKTLKGKGRNSTLISLAGTMKRRGMSQDAIVAALHEQNRAACRPPLEASEVDAIAKSIDRYEAGDLKPTPGDPSLPTIKLSVRVSDMADEAEAALAKSDRVRLYVRGSALAQVIESDGVASIHSLPEPQLLAALSVAANFVKVKTTKDGIDETLMQPPREVVSVLHTRGHWRFPTIRGLSEVPTFRPDGTLISESGYDEATGIYYQAPAGVVFSVPEHPTMEDALSALRVLREPFQDFGFGAPCFESAHIAALVTALIRPAITGSVPVFAFEASTQGTGKTLLANLIGLLATGRDLPRMPQPRDEDENCKRITVQIARGARLMLIDNLTRRFGDGTIGALITSPVWDDRVIGGSESGPWPNLTTWFVTGNNLAYHDDLIRRVIPVYLEAVDEKPEERTNFRIRDVGAFVCERRGELVSAALTLVRAFFAAGRPAQAISAYGSFEGWSRWVREPLVWLGLPDPCEARRRVEAEGDSQTAVMGAILRIWHEKWGNEPRTLRKAVEEASEELLEGFAAVSPPKRAGEQCNITALGYVFRTYKNRRIGAFRLMRHDTGTQKHGTTAFYVRRVVMAGQSELRLVTPEWEGGDAG